MPQCFVINLARSQERMAHVAAQLDRVALSYERVEAVDGSQLSPQQVEQWYSGATGDYHKLLNAAEVACYLSHRQAWQAIVERDLPYALILEDDIDVIGDLSKSLAAVAAMPSDWDYIKLTEHDRLRDVIHRTKMGEFERVVYAKIPARACAQVVSQNGAKKLLATSEKIRRPVDIDLQYWWEKDLTVFGLKPYPIKPAVRFNSEIDRFDSRRQHDTNLWVKLTNQWRFWWQNRSANRKRLLQLGGANQ